MAGVAPVTGEALRSLRQRLEWQYPFEAATVEKAKASVTELRRRVAEDADDEALPLFQFRVPSSGFRVGERPGETKGQLSAAEVGTAHHLFLQWVDLTRTGNVEELRTEAARLCEAGVLSSEEAGSLELRSLAAFWTSELGRRICAQAGSVRRELPFTARLTPADWEAAGLPMNRGLAGDDFLVVQGVIDLAVLAPQALWLVDFKTDEVTERDLPGKVSAYGPQLKLYALALERIYGRNVSERWLHFLKLGRTVAV